MIRYSQPIFTSHGHRPYPTTTVNVMSGQDVTLLKSGKVITKKPDKSIGEEEKAISLTVPVEMLDHKGEMQKYLTLCLELPKNGITKADYQDENEWKTLEMNTKIIEYAKMNLQTSWLDMAGKQLNNNFHVVDQPYFILSNLDAYETHKAELDQQIKRLGYEMSMIYSKDNKDEFINLCYLMGVNPTGNDYQMLYNTLSLKITENPDFYDKLITDADRWYRTVINKGLRAPRPQTNENYINETLVGAYADYSMDGKHIASGHDALLGYFKDNEASFMWLENELGLKKKQPELIEPKEKKLQSTKI